MAVRGSCEYFTRLRVGTPPRYLHRIYEIGGGSGTCAKGILDYIILNASAKVCNSMTYTGHGATAMLGDNA
ncbi:hypothetical protein K1719_034179 [Acacia pycnantha]|nr:hypothetical protein K1719_034179 [Acacia pycnantha]